MTSGRTVATLAARARIRELEESPEWTRAVARSSGNARCRASREIIDFSIRYGLISRETSYVAIERRETPVLGDMQLRRVPIALTSGWGGLDRSGLPCLGAPLPLRRWRRGRASRARLDSLDTAPRASAPVSYSRGSRFPSFSFRRKRRPGMAAPDDTTAAPSAAAGRSARARRITARGRVLGVVEGVCNGDRSRSPALESALKGGKLSRR